jgi:cytoskeletal protein CcmA (bactofilin family)
MPEESKGNIGKGITIIGKSAQIVGEIIGGEELTIEGRVEGKITLENKVYVEQSGQVRADVSSLSITVAGSVIGNIVVTDRAEILQGGTVIGDIKAPRLVINDGARVLGRIEMDVSDKLEAAAAPRSFEAPSNPTPFTPQIVTPLPVAEPPAAPAATEAGGSPEPVLGDFLRRRA